jgi:magnesium and cobalt transporter
MIKKKSQFIRKLRNLLLKPKDKEHIADILKQAFDMNMFDSDSLMMLEGVLNVSEMQVRDIMIPRSNMEFIDISKMPEEFIPFVIETGHSRFPVMESNKNDVIGILLAKDLLDFHNDEEFELRNKLRPVIFVTESKRLNVLLKDFKKNKNHIAIVVDEYGGVSGMVTIEDVLEQIVGDIEDEYDEDDSEDNIIEEKSGQYRIKASTEIEDFNKFFGTEYSDTEYSTVGGLITNKFGYLPEKNEKISFDSFSITILRADSRQIHTLMVFVNLRDIKE